MNSARLYLRMWFGGLEPRWATDITKGFVWLVFGMSGFWRMSNMINWHPGQCVVAFAVDGDNIFACHVLFIYPLE